MKVAVEGCCHGQLDEIYATLQQLQAREGIRVDLLICCGDFQAVRNLDDLECLACPPKYRQLGTFHRYYRGELVAPIPTLFIGGNHEASNHLWELYYGGWVAPRILYLGAAGVVRFGGLRIGGLSGIFNPKHFRLGHFEGPPYSPDSMRSAYHLRALETFRLSQLRGPLDVFLSHDWPQGIAHHGDTPRLLRQKPFLRDEVANGSLGSPPARELLHALQPRHWFSAHLHVKFAALVAHPPRPSTEAAGPPGPPGASAAPEPSSGAAPPAGAEAALPAGGAGPGADADSNGEGAQAGAGGGVGEGEPAGSGGARKRPKQGPGDPAGLPPTTAFLALDKCLPGRGFLQVVDFPEAQGPAEFEYDAEWLAVLRATHSLLERRRTLNALPEEGRARGLIRDADVADVAALLAARGGPAIPANFAPTAPAHDPQDNPQWARGRGRMPQGVPENPQTRALTELLGIPYELGHTPPPGSAPEAAAAGPVHNPEEIDLDDIPEEDGDAPEVASPEGQGAQGAAPGASGAGAGAGAEGPSGGGVSTEGPPGDEAAVERALLEDDPDAQEGEGAGALAPVAGPLAPPW